MRDLNHKLDDNLRVSLSDNIGYSLWVYLGHSLGDSLWVSLEDNIGHSLCANLMDSIDQTAQSAQNVEETNDA